MRTRIKPCDRVLRHQQPTDGHIRRTCALTPSYRAIDARAVVEGCEHEACGLMRWGFCDDGDGEGGYAEGVEQDGGVVEVFQEAHAEGIEEGLGDEQGGVDADGAGGRGDVGCFDGGEDGDQGCAAEGYACRYGDSGGSEWDGKRWEECRNTYWPRKLNLLVSNSQHFTPRDN